MTKNKEKSGTAREATEEEVILPKAVAEKKSWEPRVIIGGKEPPSEGPPSGYNNWLLDTPMNELFLVAEMTSSNFSLGMFQKIKHSENNKAVLLYSNPTGHQEIWSWVDAVKFGLKFRKFDTIAQLNYAEPVEVPPEASTTLAVEDEVTTFVNVPEDVKE